MTHAYSEYYLEDAMSNFGAMFDCAVHCYDYTLNNFYQMFLVCGIDRLIPSFVNTSAQTRWKSNICGCSRDGVHTVSTILRERLF